MAKAISKFTFLTNDAEAAINVADLTEGRIAVTIADPLDWFPVDSVYRVTWTERSVFVILGSMHAGDIEDMVRHCGDVKFTLAQTSEQVMK